jgi:hypothetical protein
MRSPAHGPADQNFVVNHAFASVQLTHAQTVTFRQKQWQLAIEISVAVKDETKSSSPKNMESFDLGGISRSYSLANAPAATTDWELAHTFSSGYRHECRVRFNICNCLLSIGKVCRQP